MIKIPKYCFKEEISKVQRIDYEDALKEYEERTSISMDLQVEIHAFEDSLPERERCVFQMKQDGYTSREIIPPVGVAGEPPMARLLKRVRNKFSAYLVQ